MKTPITEDKTHQEYPLLLPYVQNTTDKIGKCLKDMKFAPHSLHP